MPVTCDLIVVGCLVLVCSYAAKERVGFIYIRGIRQTFLLLSDSGYLILLYFSNRFSDAAEIKFLIVSDPHEPNSVLLLTKNGEFVILRSDTFCTASICFQAISEI